MPGRLLDWPAWPEFSIDSEKAEKSPDLTELKQEIIREYGEEALHQSWLRVCSELERIKEDIAEKGTSAVPEVDFKDISNLSDEDKERLKNVGCFVVRNTVPASQATDWYDELRQYLATNKEKITAWPQPGPFAYNIYFSPPQVAARSHPNQLRLQRELNSWWHDDSGASSPDPLTYADGCRMRAPSKISRLGLGLGPHIDCGSLSRWKHENYRKAYHQIFSGHPSSHDPYDLTIRQHAQPAYYPGAAQSSVLRAFQGWTALTPAGPGEGSLMVYPHIKYAIAYVLLRPFFSPPDPTDEATTLDATKWTFDPSTPFFPGTFREDSQAVSPLSHPHLRLPECLVSIPAMRPGDTVFWHADMVHAVEAEHNGTSDACVVYIAATPSTETNKAYVKEQLKAFLAGNAPHDFQSGRRMLCREGDMLGFLGVDGIGGGEEGRRAMGFGL